jgi:D-glycero-D-manno-heptose 1,7-bisphosphate phosphatase
MGENNIRPRRSKLVTARRFVLLDRDGTLIAERNYLSRVADVELLPGAAQGLRLLQHAGLGLVVLTNQSGLGRGYFDWDTLNAVHAHLTRLLANEGVSLDGIYVCPHTPEDTCDCRKPLPGLAERAAVELQFNLADSFVIGDKPCDIELGRRIGAVPLLVRTGYGALWEGKGIQADYIIDDVLAAAHIILDNILLQKSQT